MSKKHMVISLCLAVVLIIMLAPDSHARKARHDVRTWIYIHETEAHEWNEVMLMPSTREQEHRRYIVVCIPYFNISFDVISVSRPDLIEKRKIRKDKVGLNYARYQRIGREVETCPKNIW